MIYKKNNILDNNLTYTYHYDGGTKEMRDRFDLYFQFHNYNYGFNFKRLETGGMIPVRFSNECNSKAYIGKEGLASRQPGDFVINIQKSRWHAGLHEFDYVGLHEIPHSIGLNHSHMQPDAFDYILEELPNGWIEHLEIYKSNDYIKTEWFPEDIMNYRIPCHFVRSGFENCDKAYRYQSKKFIAEFRKVVVAASTKSIKRIGADIKEFKEFLIVCESLDCREFLGC